MEVWLASWWMGLEWTVAWKNYHGLGRYNLAHAWRLDRILAKARELGMHVQIVIDNHGKYSAWCDEEWAYSPYNARNRVSGGFLGRAEEFFSNERAKRLYRRKARYIFARWGYDPTVLGFELVSELDLIGSRRGFAGRRLGFDRPGAGLRTDHIWHKEMTEYFRTVDSGGRLYTTHYSGDYSKVDPVMASLEGISYVVCDGYRGNDQPFAELALATSSNHERFGKPFMVTEYGGNWNGTSEAGLEADIHSGLWGSYMTSAAGRRSCGGSSSSTSATSTGTTAPSRSSRAARTGATLSSRSAVRRSSAPPTASTSRPWRTSRGSAGTRGSTRRGP